MDLFANKGITKHTHINKRLTTMQPLQIGQRIDVWEVLPNIRYSLPIGSYRPEVAPPSEYVVKLRSDLNVDAYCVLKQLNDIPAEVKKVGTLIIKSLK